MLKQLLADTNIIYYLIAVIGVLGVAAKIVNHFTLRRLVKAAGNMPKSTHKLIKLVKSKYEHACMVHDSVENIDAFVEKYIYEYRGFLFRIHTWRQIELLSVWFVGSLAALGASAEYLSYGFTESVYQYIATGIAGVVLLSVISRLSDEPYKINAGEDVYDRLSGEYMCSPPEKTEADGSGRNQRDRRGEHTEACVSECIPGQSSGVGEGDKERRETPVHQY